MSEKIPMASRRVPPGFSGELIGEAKVLDGSQPSTVRLLAEEKPPADLDLTQMAGKAMHYLINNPRKHLDWECRFSIMPLDFPPAPQGHDPITLGDTDCRMDWEFIYMREMCGSEEGREAEAGLRRRILGYVREDGLSWVPMHHYCIPDLKDFEPAVSPWATAKTMVSLAETYARTENPQAKALARKLFLGLKGLASWEGRRAYYRGGSGPWREGKWIDSFMTVMHPVVVEPLVRYWECTGDDEAGEFALAVAEGMLANLQSNLGDHRILEDGSFLGHVHATGHAVWGLAHLGALSAERRYLDWARQVYQFVVGRQGTDYGWIPEWIAERHDGRAFNTGRGEVCAVSDMVSIGACLARAGYSQYWDWIERCIRNYLRAVQFSVTPEYEAEYRRLHGERADQGLPVMRELEGGFLGATLPNSWLDREDHMDMMGCCSPEGMRALYTAWTNVVTESNEGVLVNLSFNRDAPAARVVSFAPEQGRLTVVAKRAGDFFLRPPAWAANADRSASGASAEVKGYRDGRSVPVEWRRDYVVFKAAPAGQELSITYPLLSFRQQVEVPCADYAAEWLDQSTLVQKRRGEAAGKRYLLYWLGNTVAGLEPQSPTLPILNPR